MRGLLHTRLRHAELDSARHCRRDTSRTRVGQVIRSATSKASFGNTLHWHLIILIRDTDILPDGIVVGETLKPVQGDGVKNVS